MNMTPEEQRKVLMEMNTEDFNTMREMLSMIETKIMQLDPLVQRAFYKPVQNVICTLWHHACNTEDEVFTINPYPPHT